MSDPALGLLMLALIVIVIMMGFPTAFTLMGFGVSAFRLLGRGCYDVRLASGGSMVGGMFGILVLGSVIIIVYAEVGEESVVKLDEVAVVPGFFLSLIYLISILSWAMINHV